MTQKQQQAFLSYIQRAKDKHGDAFDYSQFEYVTSHVKGTILCKKHNHPFEQTMVNHLKKNGCPLCKFGTKEEFVAEARAVHGNKYNYSQFYYVNRSTKGEIICPTHGVFEASPTEHLNRPKTCSDCKNDARVNHSRNSFLDDAKAKFGDRFDYSQMEFVNKHTNINIICKKHEQPFEQTPETHLKSRNGCPLCVSGTKEEFVEDAIAIHGELYDYSQFVYVNKSTQGIIICSEHGPFRLNSTEHVVQKLGCTECLIDKQRLSIEEIEKRVIEANGNIFDLSKFKYKNISKPSTVICIAHKCEFEEKPSNLFNGVNSCPVCKGEELAREKAEFIAEANVVHDNKYDYSEFEYVNGSTTGRIICPIHGPFYQFPSKHIKELRACKGCRADEQRKPLEVFIQQAIDKHQGYYTYEFADYQGARVPLTITCPEHGPFQQSPDNHINKGKGCPDCGTNRTKKTFEAFLNLTYEVFGDKFDYTQAEECYDGMRKEITIICPEHGPMNMTPNQHLSLQFGCLKCSNRTYSLEEWKEKSSKAHNNKFDYTDMVFIKGSPIVTVKCPNHGPITVYKNQHIRGTGCKQCAHDEFGKKRGEERFKTTGRFKVEAILLHGDKMYDYSRSVYKGAQVYLDIYCPDHGKFQKTPTHHLHSKQICPTCNTHRGYNSKKRGCLYVLQSACGRFIKIGISNNPTSRFKDLRTNDVLNDFKILHTYWDDDGRYILESETEVHKYGNKHNLKAMDLPEFNDLFDTNFDGHTEWFIKDKRLLDFLESQFFKLVHSSRPRYSP
ncbi:DUF723 domain-containing protein [Vibrio chaetopteri]|uniref:DUF723 domain-containing protein n=1 Tax=Vibrio chaetopteri TaxID=3016528 RepID=UPI003AB88392